MESHGVGLWSTSAMGASGDQRLSANQPNVKWWNRLSHGGKAPHRLAGVGGFELSDPEAASRAWLDRNGGAIGAPYSLQTGLDWGASHSLAAQPGKVSDRQAFRKEGKFGPHFKGQFWKHSCFLVAGVECD